MATKEPGESDVVKHTCVTWDKKNVLEPNVLCNALVQNKYTRYTLSGG